MAVYRPGETALERDCSGSKFGVSSDFMGKSLIRRLLPLGNNSEPNVKYISWIITLPITVIAVIFAISNLNDIAVGFWPLEGTFSLPLYIAVLASFVVGFVCGGVVLWFSAGKVRRRARKFEFEAVGLKREIASLKQQVSQLAAKEAHKSGSGSSAGQIQTGSQVQPAEQQPNQIQLGQPSSPTAPARLTGT